MAHATTQLPAHRAGYCPRCRPLILPLPRSRPAAPASGWISADEWIRAVERAQDREVHA